MECQHFMHFIITNRFGAIRNSEANTGLGGVGEAIAQAANASIQHSFITQQECTQFRPPLLSVD
jgi:hypothetical protein